jgi:hypothetical protein
LKFGPLLITDCNGLAEVFPSCGHETHLSLDTLGSADIYGKTKI